MVTRLALLTIALIGVAGLAQAQTAPAAPTPIKTVQTANAAEAPAAAAKMTKAHEKQAMATCGDPQKVMMKDEYGFRYDSRGDRLNAGGCVIAPPHTLPGAKVLTD